MGAGNEQSNQITQCFDIVQNVLTGFPLTGPEHIF